MSTTTVTPAELHTLNRQDGIKFLNAMDKMQIAFFRVFPDNPEYLTPLHWNVCTQLWRLMDTGKPIAKEEALDWRYELDADNPGSRNKTKALVGLNKARDHLKLLLDEGYIEEYKLERYRQLVLIRPTEKLISALDEVIAISLEELRKVIK